jgi:hypothetical protein
VSHRLKQQEWCFPGPPFRDWVFDLFWMLEVGFWRFGLRCRFFRFEIPVSSNTRLHPFRFF